MSIRASELEADFPNFQWGFPMIRRRYAKWIFRVILSILPTLLVSASARAATLYVGPYETLKTIQEGIDAASNGDTVVVKFAQYRGTGNVNIDPRGKALTLTKQKPGKNPVINPNLYDRAFNIHSGETNSTLIYGFDIKYGNDKADNNGGGGFQISGSSPTIQACNISSSRAKGGGGGINCISGSSPIIKQCVIKDSEGGGIVSRQSSPVIQNCTITGGWGAIKGPNLGDGCGIRLISGSASISGCEISNGSAAYGAGIYSIDCAVTMKNTTVSNNTAANSGGGCYFAPSTSTVPPVVINNCKITNNVSSGHLGGGLYLGSPATIINSTIEENQALSGGGIYIYYDDKIISNIVGCAFNRNYATFDEGGAAIHSYSSIINASSYNAVNCTFNNNYSPLVGTIFTNLSTLRFTNCTFGNSSSTPVTGAAPTTGDSKWISGSFTATNCIFWGSSTGFGPGTKNITYSDVKGAALFPGIGNINVDPGFVDASNGDFHLNSGSPGIDTGDNRASLRQTDKDSKTRITNNIVDMGAYEYQGQ
jgi:hypothetical protein